MTIRTGREFIDGLRDEREVYYDGKRVDDVTTFPAFRASVASLASLYDLQHEPENLELMSVESPALGRIARAFEFPRCVADLAAKRETYARFARATCGMMGRSPDFLNAMLAALAAKRSFFAEQSEARAEAVTRYYEHVAG